MAAGYAATRLFYAELGLDVDTSSMDYFWQYLDPELLREDLLRSVYYQHTQPPLYNVFLGLGLRAPDPEAFFHVAAIGFGLILHLSLYALIRQLGARAPVAVAASWLFALNPASILMELWVFYTYPVAALLVASAVMLHRGLRGGRALELLLALSLMAAVVWTRSLFHLVWMIAASALAVAFARRRARAAALALVPLALASSLYVKNWLEFGQPVGSTWLGFSVSRLVTTQAPRPMLRELREQGQLSDLALHRPWLPLERYPVEYRELPDPAWAEIPALSEPRRSTGHPNFNHGAYVRIAQAFRRDARVVLERTPQVWWQSTKRAWQIHFLPIHDYTFFHHRRRTAGPAMREVERTYERLFGASAFAAWDWEDGEMPPFPERPAWPWAAAVGLSILVALREAHRRRRTRAQSATLLYCAMTVVFVAVVGNSLEVGENNRFRFLSEPLSWALVSLNVDIALAWLGRAGRRLRWRARALAAKRAPRGR